MSIFFTGSRKVASVPDPVPDWEAALVAVSENRPPVAVAAAGGLQPERAHDLIRKCREIEPPLIAAINDGTVTTKTEAIQYIKDCTEGFFPAAKFVQQMIDHCTPSTFAGLVTAAHEESA